MFGNTKRIKELEEQVETLIDVSSAMLNRMDILDNRLNTINEKISKKRKPKKVNLSTKRGYKMVTNEERSEMLKMYNEGINLVDIASALNRAPSTITTNLTKAIEEG